MSEASIFDAVPLLAPNVVLGLNAECVADPNPNKINLTIGAYRDEAGKPVILNSVREAEAFMFANKLNNGYIMKYYNFIHYGIYY